MSIEKVLKEHTNEWMKIPGVIGTGEGVFEGKPCIMILVDRPIASFAKRLPKSVHGFAILIQETGTIKAH